MSYGEPPIALDGHRLDEWTELMHYLYLPVKLRAGEAPYDLELFRFPKRLEFLRKIVGTAWTDWCQTQTQAPDPAAVYVYVTARRGFATPDNPLNRPGWHCDGFGTDDVNYVWWDRWGTRFALQEFGDVPSDHVESMVLFEEEVDPGRVWVFPNRTLYRLSPFVVHATPEIEAPGGMRSFLKISISRHRYNLVGNSHNYLFDYDWPLHQRDEMRNDPARSMADFYEEHDAPDAPLP